jgi:chemotaxis protein MotB
MASGDNYGEDRGGGRPSEEEEAEERTDGWMATYADMVTLLLTFFVLMFAISNVDQAKFALLAAGFSPQGLSQERFEEIMELFGQGGEEGGDFPTIILPPETDPSSSLAQEQLEALEEAMVDYVEAHNLGSSMKVQLDGDFLVITLPSDIAFPSASATITPEMEEIAGDLARLIATKQTEMIPFEIIVIGHTDNVSAAATVWGSNWRLSSIRATNFLEILIRESEMPPWFFSSSGYGEHLPIADNNTSDGRMQNRRVEIMITPLRQTDRLRESEVAEGLIPATAPADDELDNAA